jgi:hypothetical protein
VVLGVGGRELGVPLDVVLKLDAVMIRAPVVRVIGRTPPLKRLTISTLAESTERRLAGRRIEALASAERGMLRFARKQRERLAGARQAHPGPANTSPLSDAGVPYSAQVIR